jgi:serine/threonine-protein kinase
VVVERIERGGEHGEQDVETWVRDARHLQRLEHPNVARVRDVVVSTDEVLVVGEFVDGVRWSELASGVRTPSLEIALRVFTDVLGGLGALHDLRDENGRPLGLMHGELTPECIVVGSDGVTRIVSPSRLRSATARPGRAGSAYLAPEILLADDTANARADVYSAGVMLWEALSGRPLFPNTQPAAVLTHLLSGRTPSPRIAAGSPWAAPLADVVMRTLSVEPDKRFQSTTALAAEIARVVESKIATSARVAAFVRATFSDRIRARREALEGGAMAPAEPLDTKPALSDVPTLPSPPMSADARVAGEGLALVTAAPWSAKNPRGRVFVSLSRAAVTLGLALGVGATVWWGLVWKQPSRAANHVDAPATTRLAATPASSATASSFSSPEPTRAPPVQASSNSSASPVTSATRPTPPPSWSPPARRPAADIHYQPEGI